MRTVTTGEFEGGSVFIDGDWKPLSEAKISMFDWGFTRSDATYDVVSAWHGAFFRLDDHLDRFFASLAKMRMSIPYTRDEVRTILHGCVRAGGLRDAYVAMVCTRGVPPKGSRDPRTATNRFYAYALPFVWIAPPDKQASGIDLHVSDRIRIAPESVDPTVKNYHWLDLVQSLFDAYDRGRDTSCVVDAAGNVAEGPGFNVFVVQDGVVSHGRARRARRGVAPHGDRALRCARDPAARWRRARRRPGARRRGVPELDRRRRDRDRQDRRAAAAAARSRPRHAAAAGGLLGPARGAAPPRSDRVLSAALASGVLTTHLGRWLRRSADPSTAPAAYLAAVPCRKRLCP